MEDIKTFMILVSNLGGMGALAWVLLHLHKDALKAFREELSTERRLWTEAREQDRLIREEAVHDIKGPRDVNQSDLADRLDRIESEIRTAPRQQHGVT